MPAGQESLLVEIEYSVAYTLHQGTPYGQKQFYVWQMTFRT